MKSIQGSRVATLLAEILKNPVSPATGQLAHFLATENGLDDLMENLRAGNPLAFIYLKQSIGGWVEARANAGLYSSDFIAFLISVATRPTRHYVCEYMEILSVHGRITRSLTAQLVRGRCFDMLESVFKKYTEAPRTNELYTEIKDSIAEMTAVFNDVYFDPLVAKEVDACTRRPGGPQQADVVSITRTSPLFFDGHLLRVLHSLVYQDIHPYFEDNSDYFFKVFSVLFESAENRETVLKIYDLFTTKYPDCTNFTLLITTLSRTDALDGSVMNVLTKAFGYRNSHPDMVVQMLQRVLAYRLDEEDMETYTRDVLRGIDTSRGCAHKLIKLLYAVYSTGIVYHFSGESALFVATVLKHRDAGFVEAAKQLIARPNNEPTAVFSSFLYLISVNEVGDENCSLEYLNTDCRFICLKYLSLLLRKNDAFHRRRLGHGMKTQTDGPPLDGILPVLTGLIAEKADEFSCELLFRIVKSREPLQTAGLYEFITTVFDRIDRIDATSLAYLFDIYNLLTVKLKRFNLKIVENILNNELSDLFALCFFYLSILVQETDLPKGFIMNILGQDTLWTEGNIHLPLVLMLVSAYKRGMVAEPHVLGVCGCLSPYHTGILLSKCGIRRPVEGAQLNYIVNGVFDAGWFLDNFIDKKYCRIILNKMAADRGMDAGVAGTVADKNMRNIEYECTLHSVVCYFGI